jgi:HEAT repeat protein
MRRRTPLIALILAPFVLWAVVMMWDRVLLPLTMKMWRSEFGVRARLASIDPEARSKALRDAAAAREPDAAAVAMLVESARSDPNQKVRLVALRGLGGVGHRQSLPDDAMQMLASTVLTAQNDALLSASIEAAGKAAAKNRFSEEVVQRTARILEEQHLTWLYSTAINALGDIGAAQALPGEVFTAMNARFATGKRPGEREELARALRTIAKGAGPELPPAVLDALAAALAEDKNYRVRVHAIYALAYSNAHYPLAKPLLATAARDPLRNVSDAAAHALRIIDANQLYAGREPMAVALDRSLPVESRLKAMGPLRVNRRDGAWRDGVLALARDDDPRIAAAALDLFPYIDGSPDDEFDKRKLIPQLSAAMSHTDPQVRRAAYGTLGRQFVHNSRYKRRAQDFRPQLETGAKDPDAKVRVVALATMLRAEPGQKERERLIRQGVEDADPYVRRMAVSWLGSPRTETDERRALIARARQDPDADVRRTAEAAQEQWESRQRSWPVEWWKLLQAREYSKLGLMALTAVTVAAPVIIGLAFFIYFMARLLTYLYQRRWRTLAVLPVMGVWAAASYGMFVLYFAAGHAGHLDRWETFQLAGVLWLAIALYTAAGWGLHFAVRR